MAQRKTRRERAEEEVRKATQKMQDRQEAHRKVVEKFIADDEKNRAAVDKAQEKLAAAVRAENK